MVTEKIKVSYDLEIEETVSLSLAQKIEEKCMTGTSFNFLGKEWNVTTYNRRMETLGEGFFLLDVHMREIPKIYASRRGFNWR